MALLAPGSPIRALASGGFVAVRSYDSQSSAVRSKDYQVNVASVLRMCYENVVNAVARNIQHQDSFFSPPPCCDYITAMLRPVLRATSNIRSLFSLLLNTTPNITCPQHRNATTLKNNVCNTQQHMSATSRLNICNIEN
jgi:hypothetical protein